MSGAANDSPIDPEALHAALLAGGELALVDTRETGEFGARHLLRASNVPLSALETRLPKLVPRRGVPVVLCDDADGSASRAQKILLASGYGDVRVLGGGVSGWARAGFELFSGLHVPSKAFGELVEQRFATPRVEAQALMRRLDAGEDIVILDARPLEEFVVMSIPGAICTPGAELVYRVKQLVDRPEATVVVNCAGRTRSIIGCQSLLNAGLENPVTALKDGTMGWHLAGLELEHGAARSALGASADDSGWAATAAGRVARRFGVERIDASTLSRWRSESDERTLYVFDVRQPGEYEAGHLPDAVPAPGGQLVQATDAFVAVRDARIVLVDDTEVRALMTASWLEQMGLPGVRVLAGGVSGHELARGPVPTRALGPTPAVRPVSPETLARASDTIVVDIRSSLAYRSAHVPGARWGIRAALGRWVRDLPEASGYAVVADDRWLAGLFAAELESLRGRPVAVLEGGMAAWNAAELPTERGLEHALIAPTDSFLRPYDRERDQERAMQAYLDWEVALVDQIERDATLSFPRFD